MKNAVETVAALAFGAFGALAAAGLGIPAPFITGPAIVVTLAGLTGIGLRVPVFIRDAVFAVIGMVMGSGVTPAVLDAVRQWPLTLAGLAVALLLILVLSRLVLVAWFGFEPRTAVLSASPGHLSYVLGLGSDIGGDLLTISVVQSIRLLSLTLFVPVIVTWGGLSLAVTSAVPAPMAPGALAALVALSIVAGLGLRLTRLPAAYLIGGMAVSAAGHAAAIWQGDIPGWLSVPAFTVMGTLIGTRFCGVTVAALRRTALAGVATTAISIALAVAASFAVALATGLPLALLLVSFAPGGVETMAAMALLMHVDPAFVAAHHIFRLFVLTALVPLVLGRRGGAGRRA